MLAETRSEEDCITSKLSQIWIGRLNKYLQLKKKTKLVPVGTDVFWICKVIEGKEEEMVYVPCFTVYSYWTAQGKKSLCKSLGILPKANPTENIPSVQRHRHRYSHLIQ